MKAPPKVGLFFQTICRLNRFISYTFCDEEVLQKSMVEEQLMPHTHQQRGERERETTSYLTNSLFRHILSDLFRHLKRLRRYVAQADAIQSEEACERVDCSAVLQVTYHGDLDKGKKRQVQNHEEQIHAQDNIADSVKCFG